MAQQRVDYLKRKLKRNPDLHTDYILFMKDITDKGYAEKIPTKQLSRCDGRVWYIPNHGVYHPKKKKIRVVFDCAVTYQGISLNEQLLQGPDLTNNLIGVLLRFREHPVALMVDVESMFYQVRVPEEDAHLLLFLWWPEYQCGRIQNESTPFQCYIFTQLCILHSEKNCRRWNRDFFVQRQLTLY